MLQRVIKTLPKGLPGFLMVGGVGFFVDATVLGTLVHGFGWGDYTARFMSFGLAVTTTWWLNRSFVFSDGQTDSRKKEYSKYILVQGTGAAINLTVYSICIASNEFMDQWPVLAAAVGSITAMTFNYTGARIFVFIGNNANSSESL